MKLEPKFRFKSVLKAKQKHLMVLFLKTVMTQELADDLSEEQEIDFDPVTSKVVNAFANTIDVWLKPEYLAQKSNLPLDTVKNILRGNIDKCNKNRAKRKPGIFDAHGAGKEQVFRLKYKQAPKTLVESTTKQYLSTLTNNKEFMQAADVFTKAIANANGATYDEASALGLRFAFLYYISQEHEALAWDTNRTEDTTLEKRLREVHKEYNRKTGEILLPLFSMEAILKNMLKRKIARAFETHIPDNAIAVQERNAIRDWLIGPGLVIEKETELLVAEGREWRHHELVFDKDKILAYTNPENALQDILSKPAYQHVIRNLLNAKSDYRIGQDYQAILNRLAKLGLIKYTGSEDMEFYSRVFADLQNAQHLYGKVYTVLMNSMEAAGSAKRIKAKQVASNVTKILKKKFAKKIPNTDQVKDAVGEILAGENFSKVVKIFRIGICWRCARIKLRAYTKIGTKDFELLPDRSRRSLEACQLHRHTGKCSCAA